MYVFLTEMFILLHFYSFFRYFLGGQWSNDLNVDNPLGFNGKIAKGWNELLTSLWHGQKGRAVDPRRFKQAVSRLAKGRFSGFQQHDSQEMLIFLLDGIHEDVNKILKKPYVENRESDGTEEDSVVVNHCWDDYKRRNESIVTDTIVGQYKSTLKCPQCDRVSVTFDPFQYVTLSLPCKNIRHITITVIRTPFHYNVEDGSKTLNNLPLMTQHVVDVKSRDKCIEIKKQLASKMDNLSPENLTLVDVFRSKFYASFDDYTSTTKMRTNDEVVAFEQPSLTKEQEIYLSSDDCPGLVYMSVYNTYFDNRRRPITFGVPLLVTLPAGSMKFKQLKLHLLTQMMGMGIFGTNTMENILKKNVYNSIDFQMSRSNKNGRINETEIFKFSQCMNEDITEVLRLKPRKITFVSIIWDEDLFDAIYDGEDNWEMNDVNNLSKLLPHAGSCVDNMTAAELREEKRKQKKAVDIHQCLSDFSKPETLDRDNLW
jgi:hypothetical protein